MSCLSIIFLCYLLIFLLTSNVEASSAPILSKDVFETDHNSVGDDDLGLSRGKVTTATTISEREDSIIQPGRIERRLNGEQQQQQQQQHGRRLVLQEDCTAGHYFNGATCVACTATVTYQNLAGQTSCLPCSTCGETPGHGTVTTACTVTSDTVCSSPTPSASASPTPSESGSATPSLTTSEREDSIIQPGRIERRLNEEQQQQQQQHGRRLVLQEDCPAGHYFNGATCVACTATITYQNQDGQASCPPCSTCTPGRTVVTACTVTIRHSL